MQRQFSSKFFLNCGVQDAPLQGSPRQADKQLIWFRWMSLLILSLVLSTGNSFAQSAFSISQSGNQTDQNVKRRALGDLMDSLQTALGLTQLDCVPITINGNRSMQRFDREAFEASLIEMRDALELSFEIPARINVRTVGPILALILEAAALGPPTVEAQEIINLAQTLATIVAQITDDGGASERVWGVAFTEYEYFLDSIDGPDGGIPVNWIDGTALQDTGFVFETDVDQLFNSELVSAYDDFLQGTASLPALMDTAQLHADSGFFQVNLTNLKRYTRYMAFPLAANDSVVSIYNDPDYEPLPPTISEIELSPFGWFGKDTISFWTLPDLVSGLTLDTVDVTQEEAKLILYVEDMGGKVPDSVGFMWDTTDFAGLAAAGDSLPSDDFWTYTDPDSAGFSLSLTGLTRYTDYYFNAYADNLAGRVSASANKHFQTLPEAPELASVTANFVQDVFEGKVTDLGGDGGLPLPDATGFLWGADAALTTFTDVTGTYDSNDSIFSASISGLDAGESYFFSSYAENAGGKGYSDTVEIVTPALAITSSEVIGLTDTSFTISASFDYENVAPTSVGFIWGADASLSAPSDSSMMMLADSTATMVVDDVTNGTYYFSAFAETAAGHRRYGDTLSYYFPVPLNDDNIQAAVDLWVSDPTTAESTYGHISDWYTGAVTDMEGLFNGKSSFNDDISAWDVSQVTTMKSMFRNASAFNQDIGGWDVSSVLDMKNVFWGATSFNQDLGDWDLSSVTATSGMFNGASTFNQDIGNWDMSSVTDIQSMFSKASDFNQDIGNWDVSSVTSFSNVFNQATVFNQDIGDWDVSSGKSLYWMFYKASDFNQDIGDWDVSHVTDFTATFNEASSFNQDIGNWDVSSAQIMKQMFASAQDFNQNISNWNVASVTDMNSMFSNAKDFRGDVGNWSVGNVTSMRSMFFNIPDYSPNLQNWDVSSVVDMKTMFKQMNSFNSDISNWEVSSVTDMSGMFYSTPFNQDISGWDVSSANQMSEMFQATSAFNQDISGWDVSAANAMNSMFAGASVFDQDLGSWDVSMVTTMQSMLSNDAISRENYESTLAGWSQLELSPNVVFGTLSKICNTTDREYIAAVYNWTISDGGLDTGCPTELPSVLTQAADSSKTSATLQATLLYNGGTVISSTGFKWGEQPDLSDAQDAAGSATSGAFNAELTGLDVETKYYFTAYAANSEGTTYGDTLSFTTIAYTPVVVSNPATELSSSARTVHGKVTDDGAYAISATGIKWGLQADLSDAADTTLTMASDSTFSAALTGLEEYTTYYFSAYATNAKGTNFGDTLSFTMPCNPFPSTLQGCDAGALTSLNYQGYDYKLVDINGQCWFAENLRSENYNDGTTAIPTDLSDTDWSNTTAGAVAIYDEGGADEAFNLAQWGRLYNWYAVNTGNLCPSGWHVPTDDEFAALTDDLGGTSVAVGKMKSASCWNGTNESGFSSLASGFRNNTGPFVSGGTYGTFWSSSPSGAYAWWWGMGNGSTAVDHNINWLRFGQSVRCLRDPMVVETSDATDVGGDTGTLQGKVLHDGGSNLVATGFKWGLQADLSGAADTVVTMAADSTFAAVLTGLTTGSTYYFSAYSTNASGTVYGDTLSFVPSCSPPSDLQGCNGGSLTSISYEGYEYQVVEINGLCWFAENLRNENYNDQTSIVSGLDNYGGDSDPSGAQTVYNDDPVNLAIYGRSYNGYAVATGKLCPSGWHVPSNDEFLYISNLYNEQLSFAEDMRSESCWDGSNTLGFTALPGGMAFSNGTFANVYTYGYYWTSSPYNGSASQSRYISVAGGNPNLSVGILTNSTGLSVRCVQDGGTPTVTCGCSNPSITSKVMCQLNGETWSCN